MKDKFIRIRVAEDLHKKFRMQCIKKSISAPKQVTELLRKFVEIQEQNEKLLGQ